MFIINWSNILLVRGDIFLWTLTEAITPLIALTIWLSVTSAANTGITPRDTLTYYIISILVITSTNAWVSHFLTQQILEGELARYLTRPISVFWEHITDNIDVKFMRLAIPIPIAIAIFRFFPQWFSPSIYNPAHIILAVLSVILGAAISFSVDSILATFAFWIEDAHQIIGYHYFLWTLASGILIPYIFLPELIKTTLSFLPYRYIVSAPIEILISSSSSTAPTTLIAIQLAWLCGLVIALRFLWLRGLKRYAIPGQ